MTKSFSLLSIFLFVFNISNSQLHLSLNFDSQVDGTKLVIDTIQNSSNIWQIGTPQKLNFTTANSGSRAIVTDTINSYPINNQSDFIVKTVENGGFSYKHTATVGGFYYVSTDTLLDYGTIAVSLDTGKTWIDVINNAPANTDWHTNIPVLSGFSAGWRYFDVNIAGWTAGNNVKTGDSIFFKFSFLSDGIAENKEGLMFDDLHFENLVEGVQKIRLNDFKSFCSPVPVVNVGNISFENEQNNKVDVYIFDVEGKLLDHKSSTGDNVLFDTSNYASNTYFYKVVIEKSRQISSGKFVK